MKVPAAGRKDFIRSHLANYVKAKGHPIRSVDGRKNSYLRTKEDKFLSLNLRYCENVERLSSTRARSK